MKGSWALVTGSSSGIGEQIALVLAQKQINLILVARREDRLNELKQQITENNEEISVEIITADLSKEDEVRNVYEIVTKKKIKVEILINNAGLGIWGDFKDASHQDTFQTINVNIKSAVYLTELFLPQMLENKNGYILNISSIASYGPVPTYSIYAATKSFLTSWSIALSLELEGTGVSVTVSNAGVTETEFFDKSGQNLTWYQKVAMMKSKDVAELSVIAMFAKKHYVVPGFSNWLGVQFTSTFIPRIAAARMGGKLMK